MSSYQLGLYLQKLKKQRNLGVSELSRRTSLSRECIYKLLRGDVRQPDLSTIIILAKVLHVHPLQLLRRLFDGWKFRNSASSSHWNHDDAEGFIADITYPHNSIVCVNEKFTKTWMIQNIGRQIWRNRKLVCIDKLLEVRLIDSHQAETFHALSKQRCLIPAQWEIEISDTHPGEVVELSVEFTAPSFPCSTISYWKMKNESGDFCFPDKEGLSCLVQVVAL